MNYFFLGKQKIFCLGNNNEEFYNDKENGSYSINEAIYNLKYFKKNYFLKKISAGGYYGKFVFFLTSNNN